MATRNDITGDEIKSKSSNKKYEDGWDRIFGNKDNKEQDTESDEEQDS